MTKITSLSEGIRLRSDTRNEGRADSASVVMAWILAHVHDGRITASLSEIAGATGLKYSTVSRALQRLVGMGRIRLLPRRSSTDANTIQVMDDDANGVDYSALHDHMHAALSIIELAEGNTARLQAKIRELEAQVASLQERSDLMQGEIVKREELPGGLLMVLIQKAGS